MIAATNGWVIALDNLSRLSASLSDALCRLATGGGFATRELYSDSDEVLFDATRPVTVNGIEELATRGDLLDRAIVLYLPAIPDEQRRPEAELWQAFETARPRLLGALLDAAAEALKNLPDTTLERLPRMADVALWVTAAEPALGWRPRAFLDSYLRNRQTTYDLVLDGSTIATVLRPLVATATVWKGSATELLKALEGAGDDQVRRLKDWPKTPRQVSNALRRLAPTLRAAGFEVVFTREGRDRQRLITIRIIGESSVRRVPSVRTEIETADDGDAGADAEGPMDRSIVRGSRVQTDDADYADDGLQPLSKYAAGDLPW